MRIEVTDEAMEKLRKKGGSMSIDFIRPTGWGKIAEVSVDTNVKGKNLAPYRKVRQDGAAIYLSPMLFGLAESLRVTTGGVFGSKIVVELSGPLDTSDGCAIPTPAP